MATHLKEPRRCLHDDTSATPAWILALFTGTTTRAARPNTRSSQSALGIKSLHAPSCLRRTCENILTADNVFGIR